MKKFLSLFVVFTMIMALAACGSSTTTEDSTSSDSSSSDSSTSDSSSTDEDDAVDTSADSDGTDSVLVWNSGADPKTLDPALNATADAGNIIQQEMEGLVRDVEGDVEPGVAESWEYSDDNMTLTFHLREDAKWSDGSDLTANDFIYSWKRAMDPETASEYSYIWEYTNIVGAYAATTGEGSLDDVGISATDDYTLVIQLTQPTEYLINLLAFDHFMPVKQSSVEAEDGADGAWAKDPDLSVTNGPFYLTDYTIGDSLTLAKNPYYWDADNITLSGQEVKFIDEASTSYQAYQNGEILVTDQIPTSEISRLIAEDPTFYTLSSLGTNYFSFNMDLDVWSDARVRKAINYAINREEIADTLGTGQTPATSFVGPGFTESDGTDYYDSTPDYGLPTDDSKVEEAQELLAEAGYPDGEGFPEFTILYNTGDSNQKTAELIQEMLKTNLGITADLEVQEWAVFQTNRNEKNFEMARGGWVADFMDPISMLSIFTEGNDSNDPGYDSEEFDELISEANNATGDEHYELLHEAEDQLMEDLPIIPITYRTESWLISDTIQGWTRTGTGTMDFTRATLAE